MRKLGKTFTDNYNFKRLLQTTPDLSKRYQHHDAAVNSIVPAKHIQLHDYDGPIVVSEKAVSPHDTADFETFGPGQKPWPRRVKYAEQIPDLCEQNYIVWVVSLVEGNTSGPTKWSDRVEAKLTRVSQPTVVTYWPEYNHPSISTYSHRPVDPEQLPEIDEHEMASYFLSDGNAKDNQYDLLRCGIIPHPSAKFNATFYDYEVAQLYAKSIMLQLRDPFERNRI